MDLGWCYDDGARRGHQPYFLAQEKEKDVSGIKRYILFLPVVVVALLVLGYFLDFHKDPNPSATQLEGNPAPVLTLPALDKPHQQVTFPAKNRVTVLNFFSSWCRYSRHEHSMLLGLSGYMKTHDFDFIGINVHDTREAASKWLGTVGSPYSQVLFDDTRASVKAWTLLGTPSLFVVDAQGIVQFVHSGMLTDEIVRESVLPLLPKRAHE